jgi:hypothetical protein
MSNLRVLPYLLVFSLFLFPLSIQAQIEPAKIATPDAVMEKSNNPKMNQLEKKIELLLLANRIPIIVKGQPSIGIQVINLDSPDSFSMYENSSFPFDLTHASGVMGIPVTACILHKINQGLLNPLDTYIAKDEYGIYDYSFATLLATMLQGNNFANNTLTLKCGGLTGIVDFIQKVYGIKLEEDGRTIKGSPKSLVGLLHKLISEEFLLNYLPEVNSAPNIEVQKLNLEDGAAVTIRNLPNKKGVLVIGLLYSRDVVLKTQKELTPKILKLIYDTFKED